MLRLEVKNLNVEIDGKKILNGLDLTIEKGKVYAIRSLQHERMRSIRWPSPWSRHGSFPHE